MRWRNRDGTRWLDAELPGARVAFTTRLGGASSGPFRSLNLGLLTGDGREPVAENRRRACDALGIAPDEVLMGHQVHGVEIESHDAPQRPSPFADLAPAPNEVDGHCTAVAGLAPMVLVADCLPVALAGTEGVAMLHCGWRGLAGGIVERGARAVGATAAAVGPGIGPCCYEVGPEVLSEFGDLEGVADGRMLDLRAVATRLLADAGVTEIEVSELCTSCEERLFFSHRRDGGETGRQAGLVWAE